MNAPDLLLLTLTLATLALLSCAIWWTRYRMLPALGEDLQAHGRALTALQADVAALLGHAQREIAAREAQERLVASKIGSFLPTDEQARKVEQGHRKAQHGFLSGQTPPPPSSRGSAPSGSPSAAGSSTPGARSSRSG